GDVRQRPSLGNDSPLDSEPAVYVPATQLPDQNFQLIHTWFSPVWVVRGSRAARRRIGGSASSRSELSYSRSREGAGARLRAKQCGSDGCSCRPGAIASHRRHLWLGGEFRCGTYAGTRDSDGPGSYGATSRLDSDETGH